MQQRNDFLCLKKKEENAKGVLEEVDVLEEPLLILKNGELQVDGTTFPQ